MDIFLPLTGAEGKLRGDEEKMDESRCCIHIYTIKGAGGCSLSTKGQKAAGLEQKSWLSRRVIIPPKGSTLHLQHVQTQTKERGGAEAAECEGGGLALVAFLEAMALL